MQKPTLMLLLIAFLAGCTIGGQDLVPTPTAPTASAQTPTTGSDGLLGAPSGPCSTCAFLRLEGVEGSSTESRHARWIEIDSVQWSVAQPASAIASGAGAGSGVADFSDVVVTKRIDRSSPALFQAVASGLHLRVAQVDLLRPDGSLAANLTLSDVVLTGYETAAAGQAPVERISLTYQTIVWTYFDQGADGRVTTRSGGWDVAAYRATA